MRLMMTHRHWTMSRHRVPKKRVDPTSTTAASQQMACLRDKGHMDPNPHKQFYTDLQKFINDHKKTNKDEVLLMGDFNECLYDHNIGMGKIATTFELHDITYNAVPTINFATYGRGHKRIDYALGTARFHKALISGGYAPFGEHCHSDHRPFHLEFDNILLFGNETGEIKEEEMKVQHFDKTQGLVFLEELHELTVTRNLHDRAKALMAKEEPDHQLAEQIDKDMCNFCRAAQKKVVKKYKTPWTTKLIKLKGKVLLCQLVITRETTKRNMRNQINKIRQEHKIFTEAPPDLQQAKILLGELRTELRKLVKESRKERRNEQQDKIIQLESNDQLSQRK